MAFGEAIRHFLTPPPDIDKIATEPVPENLKKPTVVDSQLTEEISRLKELTGFTISKKNGVAQLLLDSALSMQPNDPELSRVARGLWLARGVLPYEMRSTVPMLGGIIEYGDEEGNVLRGEMEMNQIRTIVSPPIKRAFADFERLQQAAPSIE